MVHRTQERSKSQFKILSNSEESEFILLDSVRLRKANEKPTEKKRKSSRIPVQILQTLAIAWRKSSSRVQTELLSFFREFAENSMNTLLNRLLRSFSTQIIQQNGSARIVRGTLFESVAEEGERD